jgi:hypothetical protein
MVVVGAAAVLVAVMVVGGVVPVKNVERSTEEEEVHNCLYTSIHGLYFNFNRSVPLI